MLVAALDTSTLALSCALLECSPGGASTLAVRTEPPIRSGPGHSARLPGALSELLEMAGKSIRDVDGWAVGIGPGSFTGLRIGLATWKGFAYANRRPISGASSLAAMALEAAPGAPEGTLLVPLLDARKGEVYAGFYRASGGEVRVAAPEAALAPAELASRVAGGGPVVGFGEGFEAFRAALAGVLPELASGPASPSAEAVGRLALPGLGAYDEQALFALEPHYVRLSEAEVKFPNGLPVGPPAER